MSRFDDLASAYLGPPLLEFHGEIVTVHPQGGSSYTIKAVVIRDVAEQQVVGSGPQPVALLEVLDHATAGISIETLDRGTLEIEFPLERPGGKTSRRRVTNFADPVGGMITLDIA